MIEGAEHTGLIRREGTVPRRAGPRARGRGNPTAGGQGAPRVSPGACIAAHRGAARARRREYDRSSADAVARTGDRATPGHAAPLALAAAAATPPPARARPVPGPAGTAAAVPAAADAATAQPKSRMESRMARKLLRTVRTAATAKVKKEAAIKEESRGARALGRATSVRASAKETWKASSSTQTAVRG